jgi:hypothetical protein
LVIQPGNRTATAALHRLREYVLPDLQQWASEIEAGKVGPRELKRRIQCIDGLYAILEGAPNIEHMLVFSLANAVWETVEDARGAFDPEEAKRAGHPGRVYPKRLKPLGKKQVADEPPIKNAAKQLRISVAAAFPEYAAMLTDDGALDTLVEAWRTNDYGALNVSSKDQTQKKWVLLQALARRTLGIDLPAPTTLATMYAAHRSAVTKGRWPELVITSGKFTAPRRR